MDDIKRTSLLNGSQRTNLDHIEEDGISEPFEHASQATDNTMIREWDDAVEAASGKYRYENHNLITNNCHSHVAAALNRLHFRDITYWNTVLIMLYLVIYGKYVRYDLFSFLYNPF